MPIAGDIGWMGDFERCVAWAWITRNPAIEASREVASVSHSIN
jgi:hypothetical protein